MATQAHLQTSSSEPHPEREYAIIINPPLLNSSNPWATTYDDLLSLYNCPSTGAVTLRTSLWKGFAQDPKVHQYTFFSPSLGHSTAPITLGAEGRSAVLPTETSSLNTLGYSPIPFTDYCKVLINMSQASLLPIRPAKPFIVSVTGGVFEVAACFTHLAEVQAAPHVHRWKPDDEYGDLLLWMEINLSCPNIPGAPPPAYDAVGLAQYVHAIAEARQIMGAGSGTGEPGERRVHVGIKTPPYTHAGQFRMLISCLEDSSREREGWGGCPISFITSTNTLGSCLVLAEDGSPALGSETGIGGMAGAALHPLSLGNVKTIRAMLDASEREDVRKIAIIGVGGVEDRNGFDRMRSVGAQAVGVGTALGREGVGVFAKISGDAGLFEEFTNLE